MNNLNFYNKKLKIIYQVKNKSLTRFLKYGIIILKKGVNLFVRSDYDRATIFSIQKKQAFDLC